jgi:transcriptional regulator with XRE-family HTH domain
MPRRPKVQIQHAEIVRVFADRLREVRRARNVTQAELARRAGVPASYVSDLEKAKAAPGIDLVDRLAKALETSVADLLSAAPPPETEAQLRDRLKRLFDELLRKSDRDVLATLDALLALLRELSTRRR